MSGNQNQLDVPVLTNNLQAFSESVKAALAATAPAEALAANVVQVSPGGQTFSTINDAIASITDASQEKEYVVYAGPGTYNEQVTLKPWVYLQGAGPGQTIITAPPGSGQASRGTIIGSSNSSIGSLTATCTGGSWGNWDTALFCSNTVKFYAENVELIVNDDNSAGINMAAVAINDTAGSGAPTQVYIAYSTVTSTAQNGQSSSWGLDVNNKAYVEVTESKIVATGTQMGWGASSNGGAYLNIFSSYIQGVQYALNIPDYSSTLVATDCQISGPVAEGVKIVNNPPPTE
jgi:hypothetical protein